jgi:hypothetical protein
MNTMSYETRFKKTGRIFCSAKNRALRGCAAAPAPAAAAVARFAPPPVPCARPAADSRCKHKAAKQIPVLLLALAGILLFPRSLHAQEETAFFRDLSGTVDIKTPGSEIWVKAAAGDRIEKNSVISTGFRSNAIVVVGNSVITVRPLTRLSLEEIVRNQGSERVEVFLQTGRVRADVKPPGEGQTSFTVRSPVATASVRGTSFEFDTERLTVAEGRVQYSLASGRQVSVANGGAGYVNESGTVITNSFEAAVELLVPAAPPGSASGGPLGDTAPIITPPGTATGLSFEWD